jgi:hypothetical protein
MIEDRKAGYIYGFRNSIPNFALAARGGSNT